MLDASTPRSELKTLTKSAEKGATEVYDLLASFSRMNSRDSLKTCLESSLLRN